MARAVLRLSTRKLGAELDISAVAISRYERGDEKVISLETAKKAVALFNGYGIHFGPSHGVVLARMYSIKNK